METSENALAAKKLGREDKHCHDGEGCKCCEEKISGEHEEESPIAAIIKIAVSGALFVASFFLHGALQYAFLAAAYLIVGYEVIINAIKELVTEFSIDEEFLMTIATVGAWCIGEGTEAVAVMLFYSVGELLEDIACERSRKSITALLSLRPDTLTLKRGDSEEVVPLEQACVSFSFYKLWLCNYKLYKR